MRAIPLLAIRRAQNRQDDRVRAQSYWHKPVHSRASRHHLGILVARKPCTHLWE